MTKLSLSFTPNRQEFRSLEIAGRVITHHPIRTRKTSPPSPSQVMMRKNNTRHSLERTAEKAEISKKFDRSFERNLG
jgi:hypothetical protein